MYRRMAKNINTPYESFNLQTYPLTISVLKTTSRQIIRTTSNDAEKYEKFNLRSKASQIEYWAQNDESSL